MKKSVFAMLLLLSFAVSACGRYEASREPASQTSLSFSSEPQAVKPAESDPKLLSDYEFLWDTIEENYPYMGVFERVTQKDAQAVKQKYEELLPSIHSTGDFFDKIVYPCLREFEYTGHLSALDPAEYLRQSTILKQLLEQDGALSAYSQYNFDQFNLYSTLGFYGKYRVYDIANASAPKPENNIAFEFFPESATACVSVKSMTLPYENDDAAALKNFFLQIEREGYQHCIIDIRENSGGSDSYWMSNIVSPNLAAELSYRYYAFVKNGEISQTATELFGCRFEPISSFPKDEFSNLNLDDLNAADGYLVSEFAIRPDGPEPGSRLFNGKMWVLIGRRVYSSSESFAQFCKRTGFATLVGTPTGGDGMGFAPLIVSLPYSGICIQFRTMAPLNCDGSNNEEFGTAPDILISEGEDALTRCLEEILKGQ